LLPGIEGAQTHMNSRWELVKMMVMQDMLPAKGADNSKPHERGPALNCRSCTIRNDVITSFWGLPKRVSHTIAFGQTHIRAGIIEPLLDELILMALVSTARTSQDSSLRSMGAVRSQLTSIIRQYRNDHRKPAETPPPKSQRVPTLADVAAAAVARVKAASEASHDVSHAREHVNHMLFKLHELLSKLRLERYTVKVTASEIVFDLPLAKDARGESLVITAPGMLRWRQKHLVVAAGYSWAAISDGKASTTSMSQYSESAADSRSSSGDDLHSVWTESTASMQALRDEFAGHETRPSKDSTAFFKFSTGTVQATALRTPSMTTDRRAEELLPDCPGFKLRKLAVSGEMSAFLSEDLSHMPSPQPTFEIKLDRPELSMDLRTQLAVDETKAWFAHIVHRAKIVKQGFSSHSEQDTTRNGHRTSLHMHALANMVFADVQARIFVDRAVYGIRPFVPHATTAKSKDRDEAIVFRVPSVRMQVVGNLLDPQSHYQQDGVDSSDSSGDESFATGKDTLSRHPSQAAETPPTSRQTQPLVDPLLVLMPHICFSIETSPISAAWESLSQSRQGGVAEEEERERAHQPKRRLFKVTHGIHGNGTVDLHLGPAADLSLRPRVDADIDLKLSTVAAMLREYDFNKWLAMQPLWLVTRLTRLAGLSYSTGEPEPAEARAGDGEGKYAMPPIEQRRRNLTGTLRVAFKHVRWTVLACDNEEDVRSGIEHGTQLSFSSGHLDVRANGGSLSSPHQFGFRPDAARITLNLDCDRAKMFMLSAVPPAMARDGIADQLVPDDFCSADLCGSLPDSVQSHIVLLKPVFNFSSCKLAPHRSRMIIDLTTTEFSGEASVSSVYRWAVFMHHLKYWHRRKKLALRMATQVEPPSPPDDMLVSISTEVLHLNGDLVSPIFCDLDKGLLESLPVGLDEDNENMGKHESPRLKLKVPKAQLTMQKSTKGTDNDTVIAIKGPLMTLYGSSTPFGQLHRTNWQPLLSMDVCAINFRLPRKAKCAELGAQQGVRRNSTYDRIDVVFEKAAMAIGHRYNMAETIDGYILMQKGCKRIARKSTSTCHPPLPFPETALSSKPTVKMVLAALGNPRTYAPPPLRSMTGIKPAPPPTLLVADDIPTIDFHGPEFNMLVHDDPFETALTRIYRAGLREQRERLNRLEAFEAKAKEIREMREQEYAKKHQNELERQRRLGKRASSTAAGSSSRSKHKLGGHLHGSKSRKSTPKSHGARSPMSKTSTQRPKMTGAHTIGAAEVVKHAVSGIASSREASASAQDLPSQIRQRGRTPSDTQQQAIDSVGTRSFPSLPEQDLESEISQDSAANSDYDDIPTDTDNQGPPPDPYQQMRESVDAEIAAAEQRLREVESRLWVKAIREKMMPPPAEAGSETVCREMHFEEILDMPPEDCQYHREQECGGTHAKPPYNYVSGSWTHPAVALARFTMSPVWVSIDTPLSLLEFDQIENYLRYLDPTTPHKLKWSTLVPTRLRVKCGEIRMQLRDFPFPLFSVPDPYRTDTSRRKHNPDASYEELFGGVEVSASFIIAERTAQERSLRSIYVPVGPRSRDSGVQAKHVGWYVSKSLQFPRIYTSMSILMFAAQPKDKTEMHMLQGQALSTHLPPLPIMSTWGASYQPVISAMMQRLETATSKSADVSPALSWWDKLRSRMHFRCRMAVVNAPRMPEPPKTAPVTSATMPDPISMAMSGGFSGSSVKLQPPPPLGAQLATQQNDEGQMFFLALDGRDPYQVTQKTGGYLVTMRGGVRICLNEGFPGKELWDEHSGSGIFSVPTEDGVPPPATQGEFMRIRCKEFLMGVPVIIDRKSAILKAMNLSSSIKDGALRNSGPGLDDMEIDDIIPHLSKSHQPAPTQPAHHGVDNADAQAWRKAHINLLYNISRDNSARYTFITDSASRLYHKIMLHLQGGVRVGIGLSAYIAPDQTGLRRNHWEVQPIAPEHAASMALRGVNDAYFGFRSTKLHTEVSLRCPFTDADCPTQEDFSELYLSTAQPAPV
ncbi:Protein SABRE, partial [Linderina pennispora]